MNKTVNGGKHFVCPPKTFVAFVIGLMVTSLFTTTHVLIYNWVFLRSKYQGRSLPIVITSDILKSYWEWPAGKVLIGLNLACFAGLIVLWFVLKRIKIN